MRKFLLAHADSLIIHEIRRYADILLAETQILCNFPVQNFTALKFLYQAKSYILLICFKNVYLTCT